MSDSTVRQFGCVHCVTQLKVVVYSVSVGFTFDPSYSSKNTRITLAATFHLADASHLGPPFFRSLHVVRLS
jgi:hypothetical protein